MTELHHIKTAQTSEALHPIIKNRWSPRAFSTESITQEEMNTLLTAATWAASGGNGQPWMFIYALKGTPEFELMLSCLNPSNQVWAKDSSALVMTLAKVKNPEGKPLRMALHDTGSAMTTMLLQAQTMDIYGHPMGGYDFAKVKATYQLPEEWDPAVIVALGRLGSAESLNEELKARELAPRTRKQLSEVAFTTTPFGKN